MEAKKQKGGKGSLHNPLLTSAKTTSSGLSGSLLLGASGSQKPSLGLGGQGTLLKSSLLSSTTPKSSLLSGSAGLSGTKGSLLSSRDASYGASASLSAKHTRPDAASTAPLHGLSKRPKTESAAYDKDVPDGLVTATRQLSQSSIGSGSSTPSGGRLTTPMLQSSSLLTSSSLLASSSGSSSLSLTTNSGLSGTTSLRQVSSSVLGSQTGTNLSSLSASVTRSKAAGPIGHGAGESASGAKDKDESGQPSTIGLPEYDFSSTDADHRTLVRRRMVFNAVQQNLTVESPLTDVNRLKVCCRISCMDGQR